MALIFQVIFIFFALLINVGLLVHHKINLQQSTDLAAYYGAMKQAESLNAIAHINFQVKQAWKLLTWRYRVLGTFGFQKNAGLSQNYPFEFDTAVTPNKFVYNGSQGSPMTCSNLTMGSETLGVQDIPFFCIGHPGFAQWAQSESLCKLNCNSMEQANTIAPIPLATNIVIQFGGNVAPSINAAVNKVNTNMAQLCELLGPTGASVFTRFMAAYINDTKPRLKTIEALAANLSLDADKVLDIEGNLIQKGSELTLKNNLTEANLTGYQAAGFKTQNGLAHNSCKFKDGLSGQEFLKKIEFQFIRYFIHNCISYSGSNYKPEDVYADNGQLSSAFSGITAEEREVLQSILTPGEQQTVGYEKNPYCTEYYAVKASSEPQIPFLPLTKIKLHALAIAKPFGGSIGPWYGNRWNKGSPESEFVDSDQTSKTDQNLPIRKLSDMNDGTSLLSKSVFSQPNFSLYVGDKKGLRDLDYIAAYHSALAVRDIENYPGKSYNNLNTSNQLSNSGPWPDYKNWNTIGNAGVSDFRDYDSLAANNSNDAGTRALEITAIAPNQFDITYYSIEPDFYNNYYKKLYTSGLQKILDATNRTSTMKIDQLRADFGAVGMRADQPEAPPLTDRTFSVKDQILLKNTVLNTTPLTPGPGNQNKTYTKVLDYLVSLQSSLLTSWTFLSFSDYDKFPAGPVDVVENTMSFGQCNDTWNNTRDGMGALTSNENFKTPMDTDATLPPTPGNCVTGGRTGYSVKLMSPNMVRDADKLENPLDSSFFGF